MRARISWAALALVAATPALADVKAGVDAWARGDYAAAVEQWRGLAIAGDTDAQFNMGQAYKLGRGVPVDLAQAEAWYAKAAARGHVMASDDLGLLLNREGKRAQALPWLEKSAARDERRAELILGTMLFNGDGVPKDEVRSYALISRSSQQGLAQASTALAQMDGYLTPEQRQRGIALAGDIESRAKATRTAALAAAPRGRQPDVAPAADRAVDVPATARPTLASVQNDRKRPGACVMASGHCLPGNGPSPAPPAVKPRPPVPVVSKPLAPTMASAPVRPAPHVVASGRYRVQLGAFREPGAAQALWARVGGRVGGQPSYSKAGAITRLQAGPFASRADAERACRAAGVTCVVVPG